jgi:CheY-like chemotaxis protein
VTTGAAPSPVVLLVDDFDVILAIYEEVLQDVGIRVRLAASGQDAIQQAIAHRPDLIVMDLKMPGLDGLETTRRLKADPRTAAIPVLAFTGDADEGRVRAAGCVGLIRKPCTAGEFIAAIEPHLRR